MTLLEKAKEMGLEIRTEFSGGEYVLGCPYMHKLETYADSMAFCNTTYYCSKCYAREYVPVE